MTANSPSRPLVGVQLDSLAGLTEPKTLEQQARQVDELGIEITTFGTAWGSIEKDDGIWDWARLEPWLYLRDNTERAPVPVFLLFPIHMNERGDWPADLKGEPLDSPKLLDRWRAFIETFAERSGMDEANAIVTVGNEIDWFIGVHPEEAMAAIQFLDAAAQIVGEVAPNSRPINTLQYSVLDQPWAADVVGALNAHTALCSFTWYDLSPTITGMVPPTPLQVALDKMVAAANGKPVFIQEISMPTKPLCGTTEADQVARVDELFEVLGGADPSVVAGAVWLTIEDWPVWAMQQYVSHQFKDMDGDDTFLQYLTSLGIKREDGSPKPAFDRWLAHAAARR